LALSQTYSTAPRAVLCADLPTFLAAGALLGKIVAVSRLPEIFLETIRDDDEVRIDTRQSILSVHRGMREGEDSTREFQLQAPEVGKDFQLTDEERRIVDGAFGKALQECIGFLVDYGKAVGANRLIPIASVHAAGAGYNTTGEAARGFLRRLAEMGLKAAVPATLNPIALDLQRWDSVQKLPKSLHEKQLSLNEAFRALGFIGIYSCKPYWTHYAPKLRQNVVSSEHNVVSYANTVIGARTNFESNIVSVVAALVGRIPFYGLYLDENRHPRLKIRVDAKLNDEIDWRCLGVAAARRVDGRIPYFYGVTPRPTDASARALCASFGPPWTSVPMLHVENFSAEWETARPHTADMEEFSISSDEIRRVRDELFAATDERIDLVALGCPQASVDEIQIVADGLRAGRVAEGTRLWVWTDAETRAEAEALGLVSAIHEAGGEVIADTCGCAACPIDRSAHGVRHVATDSTKSVGFLNRSGLKAHLGSVGECIDAAMTGTWRKSKPSG
jgi:predicted aconitase